MNDVMAALEQIVLTAANIIKGVLDIHSPFCTAS